MTKITSPRSPLHQSGSSDLPAMDKLSISSVPPGTGTATGTAQTTDDELERFRAQWRQEVSRKAVAPTATSTTASQPNVNAPEVKGETKSPVKSTKTLPAQPPPLDDTPPLTPASSSSVTSKHNHIAIPPASGRSTTAQSSNLSSIRFNGKAVVGSEKDRAVQVYSRAVESEQSGKLNEALMLYRQAFKLDDDVDRLYTRSIKAATQATQLTEQTSTQKRKNDEDEEDSMISLTPTSADIVSSSAPIEEPYSFQRHIQVAPDYERSHPPAHPETVIVDVDPATTTAARSNYSTSSSNVINRPSILTSMISSLPIHPSNLTFLPEDESLPIPISLLPTELLDSIFTHLDICSIERFGSTCWRARYLTHLSAIWKNIAFGIYKYPSILSHGHEDEHDSRRVGDLAKRHHGEWRTTFVEEERVRMDGCYISVCHYIRPGAGEQWVAITHLITYHRFLRFYPDGSCISFLTTDHPSEVVPILRPSLRAKGLHFGRWRLIRSDSLTDHPTEAAENEADTKTKSGGGKKKSRPRARIEISQLLEPGSLEPKYEFEMELALRETARGRWNKLDILDYRSLNLLTGESLGLTLNHQNPFYFSKVRSYNPPL